MTEEAKLSENELRDKLTTFKDNLVNSISSTSEKINSLEKEMVELHSELSNLHREDLPANNMNMGKNDETRLKEIIRPEFERMTHILLKNLNPSETSTKPLEDQTSDEDGKNTIREEVLQEVEIKYASQKAHYDQKISALESELQTKNQENKALRKSLKEDSSKEIEHYVSNQDELTENLSEKEFLTSELKSLRVENASLDQRMAKDQKIQKGYKTELTYLKKILGEKNGQIKELINDLSLYQEKNEQDEKEDATYLTNPPVNQFQINLQSLIDEMETKINSLSANLKTEQQTLAEKTKIINVQNSTIRSFEANIKRLEEKIKEHENETTLIKANQELDQIIKALWKIEKNIGIFEKTTDLDLFERHLEVYSLLLGKIFESKPLAVVLDCLLENKTVPLHKRLIIQECGLEPFTAIKLLKELHSAKVIYFDEEGDTIELLM